MMPAQYHCYASLYLISVPISEEEENINSTDTSVSLYLITAAGVVIVTGVNLAFFYWLRSRGWETFILVIVWRITLLCWQMKWKINEIDKNLCQIYSLCNSLRWFSSISLCTYVTVCFINTDILSYPKLPFKLRNNWNICT